MGLRATRARRAFLRSGLAVAPAALAVTLATGKLRAQSSVTDDGTERRLTNGQKQTDAILKADYELNIKDARALTALARSIELDFDKNDENVLSLGLLRKLDDVDKLTKRIRMRIRR